MSTYTDAEDVEDARNLAARMDSAFAVRLDWDTKEDKIYLTVTDFKTGDTHVSEVPKANAMDAFDHPFVFLS